MNFEGPIENLKEEQLLNTINHHSIEGAQVAMGELARRSTKELKKSIDKLDKSTSYYSKAISVLTLFLIVIATEQLLITIFPPKGIWILIYVLPDIALLAMAMWLVNKALSVK